MQRLLNDNPKNDAKEYNRIFRIRKHNGVDEFDLKRWNLLLKYYKGGKLIDLGCLDSLIPKLAKKQHPLAEIWGLDQAEEAVAEMQAQNPKVLYHIGDLYNTKFHNKYFDYVVMGEVLEHLDEPEAALREALRILRPRGTLALSVPLEEAREPGAKDLDRHVWSYTEQDFRELLSPYQLEFEVMGSQQKPYKYNFPNLIVWCKKYANH